MADSSSWGCGNSGFEAERLSKTNRVKEAFNKDYDTLRKFIDMMQAAESLNVEDYNDVIIEKHNESVGYLKTAIFQAQSNVMDEVARQREVGSKTKFRYLKTSSGQKRQDGGAGNEAERGNQGESENESQSSETMSNASTDCAVSDEVGVPVRVEEEGQVLVLMDEQRSSAVARSNSHQAIAKHNKILTSLRKVASKSMMPDAPQQAVKASGSSTLKTNFALTEVQPPTPKPKTPSPVSMDPRRHCGLPPVSRNLTTVAPKHRDDHESADERSNVFASFARPYDPNLKPRRILSVEPQRKLQPNHNSLMKRPVDIKFGRQSALPASLKKPRLSMPPSLLRSYDIGTVVMAKYLKYSYWPAIVVKRPPFSIENAECIHVMFWEGKEKKMKTSLADVHFSLVRPWEDREKAQELVPKNRRRKDWNESIDLAEEMVLLTPEERFWKMILIEEKIDLETDYQPESDETDDKSFPRKGDVVVVGRDTFFPGIITREELFNDNLKREIYYVNGHLHVSFLEENTHGWYPIRDVWILGKSCGEPWPVPNGQAGNKIRSSMEVARRVLKMQREERFHQVGAFAMQ